MRGQNHTFLFVLVVFFIGLFNTNVYAVNEKPAEPQAPAQQDNWEFGVEFYLWGPELTADLASGGDIDMSFNDILDNLDFTFMGAFGARKGKWSLITDVIYMDLSVDGAGDVSLPPGPLGFGSGNVSADADVGMKSWVVTPYVGYTVIENDKVRLDVLAGARYLNIRVDLDLHSTTQLNIELPLRGFTSIKQVNDSVSGSGHNWDGVVGFKGHVNLNEKWYMPYLADVGTGDSDLTWQAWGGVGYKFSKVNIEAGYRYMTWNFDDSSPLKDLDISGPLLGVKYAF